MSTDLLAHYLDQVFDQQPQESIPNPHRATKKQFSPSQESKVLPCTGDNDQIEWRVDNVNNQNSILVTEQMVQQLKNEIVNIKNQAQSSTAKSKKSKESVSNNSTKSECNKAKKPSCQESDNSPFSIDPENQEVKLTTNKNLLGKTASPKGYSKIKDYLFLNPEFKKLHSRISRYQDRRPRKNPKSPQTEKPPGQEKKPRPVQLLNHKMVAPLIDAKTTNKGGIDTMLITFEEEVLKPIEDARADLPNIFPKVVGEAFSDNCKVALKIVIFAHFETLPEGLFFWIHLYCIIKKDLLDKGKTEFGAEDRTRIYIILSKIKELILRMETLMKSLDFLKKSPSPKDHKLETYWNQDLLFTPGSLIFNLVITPQDHQTRPALIGLDSANSSSEELFGRPSKQDSLLLFEQEDSLSAMLETEHDRVPSIRFENSCLELLASQTLPKNSSTQNRESSRDDENTVNEASSSLGSHHYEDHHTSNYGDATDFCHQNEFAHEFDDKIFPDN